MDKVGPSYQLHKLSPATATSRKWRRLSVMYVFFPRKRILLLLRHRVRFLSKKACSMKSVSALSTQGPVCEYSFCRKVPDLVHLITF